jgi:hypothetical protein
MDNQRLQQLLKELHAELAEGGNVDPESTALLKQLAADIAGSSNAIDSDQGEPQDSTIQERLEQASADFEADHPQVAGILGRIVDALGKIGI